MSIIHDALKKAEASKLQKSGETAVDPAAELIAKMAPASKKKAASPRLVILASALCLGAVAAFLFAKPLLKKFSAKNQAANPIAVANPGVEPGVGNVPVIAEIPVDVPATQSPQTDSSPILAVTEEASKSEIEKNQKEAQKLSAEFLSLYDKQSYAEALKVMEALMSLAPTDPVVYNDYGVLLKRLGREREALEAYNKALALSPDYVEALNNAAAIYIADRNYAEAKELLQKAIDLRPDYLDAMLNIAIAYEKNDELEKAKVWYRDFLQKSEGRVDKKIRLHIEERLAGLSEL